MVMNLNSTIEAIVGELKKDDRAMHVILEEGHYCFTVGDVQFIMFKEVSDKVSVYISSETFLIAERKAQEVQSFCSNFKEALKQIEKRK